MIKETEANDSDKITCLLNNDFQVTIHAYSREIFVLYLKGELQKIENFSCSVKLKDFVQRQLSDKVYFVVDFTEVRVADLEASKIFFSAIINWTKPEGVYLVAANDIFRLSVKLIIAHDPYLLVYWIDSTESALAAINTAYHTPQVGFSTQPIFNIPSESQRFYELWETHRQIKVINDNKYRLLRQSEWFHEEPNGAFFSDISVIEGKIQYIRITGRLSYRRLMKLRRLQDQMLAELEMRQEQFFCLLDIVNVRVNNWELVKFFIQEKQPLLLSASFGFIGTPSFQKFLIKVGNRAWGRRGKPVYFFKTIEDAFAFVEKTAIPSYKGVPKVLDKKQLKKQVELQEIENDILQNNIEVSREKLFHLIALLNWEGSDGQKKEKDNNTLYHDLFKALILMKKEFSEAWSRYQEKLWLLQANKEKALRTQLDPHFIFNSLNSIRQVIMEKDAMQAAELLNDFSDLMRLLIHNSFKTKVELADEIDYLILYAKMEVLRFDGRFTFELNKTEEVESAMAELALPPVLIQPYLEQAIWERVLPAPYSANIELFFELEDNILKCRIQDTGLSFSQAHRKLNDFTKERENRLSNLRARLQLIKEVYECEINVFQTEISSIGGQPVISEIAIQIPQHCF